MARMFTNAGKQVTHNGVLDISARGIYYSFDTGDLALMAPALPEIGTKIDDVDQGRRVNEELSGILL